MTANESTRGGSAPKPKPHTPATATTGSLAEAKLGTADLVAQSLAVGPITSAALLGGIVAARGGSAGPLYMLIAAVGILGLGAVIVMFARKYTHAGVMYEYVGRSIGPSSGIATAGFYYLAYIILGGPTMLLGIGVLGHDMFQSYLGCDIPFWLISVAALGLVTAINVRGVDLSVRTQLAIFVLSVVPYLVIAIAVIVQGGADGNTAAVLNPSAPTAGSFLPTFMFCALLYVGVESAASLGEEAKEPRKSVPRAIIATIVIVAAFCFLMQYAGTIGFGLSSVAEKWSSDPLGLSTLGQVFVGGWIAPFAQLGLVLDMTAVAIGFMVAASRGLFALSRGGLLPRRVATLSRWKTPVAGIAIFAASTVICLVLVIMLQVGTGMDPYVGFVIGTTFGGLLVMFAYFVLVVAAIVVLIRRQWRPTGWIAAVLALVTVGAGIVGSVIPMPADESRYGIWGALVLMFVCTAWGLYHGRIKRHTLPTLHTAEDELDDTSFTPSHLI